MSQSVKPRNRLVNVRVTEDELIELRQACDASGSRGLSEFVRSAILQSVRQAGPPDEPAARPAEPDSAHWIEDRLDSLNLTGKRLVEVLNTLATHFAGHEKE